jgi:RHS repeat-associated protein
LDDKGAGTTITNRDYTGQEHLNQFGLINLNARLYDPKLAQFTGLDPFVQDPGMGQNFNRYSYCLNNPLIYSDPSGNNFFKWLKKTFWDTPWSWLNGTDKGHPGVYSGGVAGTLNKWGVPSFGVSYNSYKGFGYKAGNNPYVYPGQEAALQRQFAAVSAQTQAMIAGERQQRGAEMAWNNLIDNGTNVGKWDIGTLAGVTGMAGDYAGMQNGSFRLTNGQYNGSQFSFKYYETGWKGGSVANITTYSISKLGTGISAGANVLSTYLAAQEIANGNSSPVTYVDAAVGLTGVLNSAASYYTGKEIPIVGEFVMFYGVMRTTWDVFFYLGQNYGPSTWYGTDNTKWFK